MTHPTREQLLDALENVERIAFMIRPPNMYRPILLRALIECKSLVYMLYSDKEITKLMEE